MHTDVHIRNDSRERWILLSDVRIRVCRKRIGSVENGLEINLLYAEGIILVGVYLLHHSLLFQIY